MNEDLIAKHVRNKWMGWEEKKDRESSGWVGLMRFSPREMWFKEKTWGGPDGSKDDLQGLKYMERGSEERWYKLSLGIFSFIYLMS